LKVAPRQVTASGPTIETSFILIPSVVKYSMTASAPDQALRTVTGEPPHYPKVGGPSAELVALNRTTTGLLLRSLASVAVLLIVVDMIWKPGA